MARSTEAPPGPSGQVRETPLATLGIRPLRLGRSLARPLTRPTREGYALAAIVLIGFGAATSFGYSHSVSLLAITGGGCFAVLSGTGGSGRAGRLSWSLAAFCGAMSTGFLLAQGPVDWLLPAAGGLGAIVAIAATPTAARLGGCVLAALPGAQVLAREVRWGQVNIDVFAFTQRASWQLLHGQDPYQGAYQTTSPHLALAHYFYLPAVFLLSVPGRLLGDIRVSNLLAVVALIVALTVLARRHGGREQGWRCLALGLTLPFLAPMIYYAWAEVYLMAAIVLWLALRERHKGISVVILGVGIATVPTALPLLILPFLWWPRPRRELLSAAGVALLVCFPFVVWAGPEEFVKAALLVSVSLPPRLDGLDLDSVARFLTGSWLPFWVWPSASLGALVLVIRSRERSWARAFYLGSALLLVAFVFAKWAFFNYYFLVAVALVLAMALAGGVTEETESHGEGRGGRVDPAVVQPA